MELNIKIKTIISNKIGNFFKGEIEFKSSLEKLLVHYVVSANGEGKKIVRGDKIKIAFGVDGKGFKSIDAIYPKMKILSFSTGKEETQIKYIWKIVSEILYENIALLQKGQTELINENVISREFKEDPDREVLLEIFSDK